MTPFLSHKCHLLYDFQSILQIKQPYGCQNLDLYTHSAQFFRTSRVSFCSPTYVTCPVSSPKLWHSTVVLFQSVQPRSLKDTKNLTSKNKKCILFSSCTGSQGDTSLSPQELNPVPLPQARCLISTWAQTDLRALVMLKVTQFPRPRLHLIRQYSASCGLSLTDSFCFGSLSLLPLCLFQLQQSRQLLSAKKKNALKIPLESVRHSQGILISSYMWHVKEHNQPKVYGYDEAPSIFKYVLLHQAMIQTS